MLRLALLLILFVFIARAFWRLVDGVIEGATGQRPPAQQNRRQGAVQMVRDPVCGTFLLPERAIAMSDDRHQVFFCSTTCRDKYRARTA